MATAKLSNGATPTKFQKHSDFPKIHSLYNFRQVESKNGLATKKLLFRSSRPDLLQADEVDEFMSLGIKCIVDLRSHAEFSFVEGNKYLQTKGLYRTCVVNLPKNRNYKPGEKVTCTVEKGQSDQKEVFGTSSLKLLTKKENLPALINCAHGKDRTGIMSALVLLLLGETTENVIQDYTQSEKALEPIKPRLHDEIVKRFNWDESFMYAKPETLEMALNHIHRKYGSVENYLESIGFGRREQQLLRENLGYSPDNMADSIN